MITYAKLSHLKDPIFQKCHREIKEYHEKVNYFYDWSRQWEYPWLLKNIPFHSSDVVLDVGGGTSHFHSLVSKRVKHVIIGDLSQTKVFLPIAQNVSFLKVNASDFKENEKYDIVLSVSVLEHIKKCYDALRNIANAVKKNGILAVTIDLFLDNSRNFKKDDLHLIFEILNDFEFGEIDLSTDELYSKKNLQKMKMQLPNLYNKNYADRTSLGIIIHKK